MHVRSEIALFPIMTKIYGVHVKPKGLQAAFQVGIYSCLLGLHLPRTLRPPATLIVERTHLTKANLEHLMHLTQAMLCAYWAFSEH